MDNAVVLCHVVFHGLPDVPDMRPLGREKAKALLDMPSLVIGLLKSRLSVAHNVGFRGAEIEQHRQDRAHELDVVGVKRLTHFFGSVERKMVDRFEVHCSLIFGRQGLGEPAFEALLDERFNRRRLQWHGKGGKKAFAVVFHQVEQQFQLWLFHRDVCVLKMRPEPDENGVVIPHLGRLDVDRPLRQAKEDFAGDVTIEGRCAKRLGKAWGKAINALCIAPGAYRRKNERTIRNPVVANASFRKFCGIRMSVEVVEPSFDGHEIDFRPVRQALPAL